MTRRTKPTVYEAMTSAALKALAQGQAPEEAWEIAKLHLQGTPSTLNKGCPRSAFLSLTRHGYIAVYQPSLPTTKKLSDNARHCLDAWAVWKQEPALINSKRDWWRATRAHSGTTRENPAGILDVLRTLIKEDALTIPDQSI